jgi:hypothetical protein
MEIYFAKLKDCSTIDLVKLNKCSRERQGN